MTWTLLSCRFSETVASNVPDWHSGIVCRDQRFIERRCVQVHRRGYVDADQLFDSIPFALRLNLRFCDAASCLAILCAPGDFEIGVRGLDGREKLFLMFGELF